MKIGKATITSASSSSSCSLDTETEKPVAFGLSSAISGFCTKPSCSRNVTRSLPVMYAAPALAGLGRRGHGLALPLRVRRLGRGELGVHVGLQLLALGGLAERGGDHGQLLGAAGQIAVTALGHADGGGDGRQQLVALGPSRGTRRAQRMCAPTVPRSGCRKAPACRSRRSRRAPQAYGQGSLVLRTAAGSARTSASRAQPPTVTQARPSASAAVEASMKLPVARWPGQRPGRFGPMARSDDVPSSPRPPTPALTHVQTSAEASADDRSWLA